MTDNMDIAAAERRATAARARLTGSVQLLQAKLKPKVLARDAVRSAADAGENAARSGLAAVRDHPAPVAGAALVAGLFLARHRLAALFRRRPRGTPSPRSEQRKSR